eukprot:6205769-Pleurochrysis_carterae.AAC.1
MRARACLRLHASVLISCFSHWHMLISCFSHWHTLPRRLTWVTREQRAALGPISAASPSLAHSQLAAAAAQQADELASAAPDAADTSEHAAAAAVAAAAMEELQSLKERQTKLETAKAAAEAAAARALDEKVRRRAATQNWRSDAPARVRVGGFLGVETSLENEERRVQDALWRNRGSRDMVRSGAREGDSHGPRVYILVESGGRGC